MDATMNQDEEHLRLLSIFHYVVGGLLALFACIPFIHLFIGLLMLFAPEIFGPGPNQPPRAFGLMFVVIACVIILIGWALAGAVIWAGRCLAQQRHHTFCLVVAALSCFFVPVGTVLGVFTIVVLVRTSVKTLFERQTGVIA